MRLTVYGEVAQTRICHQRVGLGREAQAASLVLKVVTEPEYPEDNLRELMWDSNPNREIARETKKEKKSFSS